VEQEEECDDGNGFLGDGCSAVCKEEPKIQGIATCGNGVQELGEDCDDGNRINGDGCSFVCEIEEQRPQVAVRPQQPDTQVSGVSTKVPVQPEPQSFQQIKTSTDEPVVQKPVQPQIAQRLVGLPVIQQPVMSEQDLALIQWQQMLAQAQWQQQYVQQNVIPISPQNTPIGDTGPATILIFSAGAAAGLGFIRKKKR